MEVIVGRRYDALYKRTHQLLEGSSVLFNKKIIRKRIVIRWDDHFGSKGIGLSVPNTRIAYYTYRRI
jgi:hypothetical protein